jgi:hypothetical protein
LLVTLPPPVYAPNHPLRELGTSELLLTMSFRLFAEMWFVPSAATPDWRGGLLAAGLPLSSPNAAERLFTIMIVAYRRSLEIHCPHHTTLSRDEGRLLQIVGLAQRGCLEAASALLGEWLPAAAQRLAAVEVHGLAKAFATRGLLIPWRHFQAGEFVTDRPIYRQGLALVH